MENNMIKGSALKNPETKPFRKFVKSIPMATCGLALGLAALGNLFQSDSSIKSEMLRNTLRLSCGFLSLVVLIVFALKIFLDCRHAKEELKTSIPASVLPTVTMTLMLLAAYLKKPLLNSPKSEALNKIITFFSEISIAIWFTAVAIHICLMVFFFRKFVADLKTESVFPSWFIAFVGLVVASVTAPAMNAVYIGQAFFYVGFVFYFVCLFLVVRRMIKIPHKLFPEPARPTIAIFTAPMSLLIVGYFQSFKASVGLNNKLLYVMLAIAIISYIFALIMMVPSLIKRFYPTFSSFTFPLVISAMAFRLCAGHISAIHKGFKFFVHVANVTQWIAAAAVLYVIIEYIRYFIYWRKF